MLSTTLSLPSGRTLPATLFLPKGSVGPHPGVVVIHDMTGMLADTHRHCQAFADAGYAAIAPDLYGGGSLGCIVRTLTTIVRQRGPALEGIEAARQVLADHEEVDGARIGVTGFCMGGGFALLAGADHAFAVAAPFYGMVPSDPERLRGLCPTLAQFGARDLMLRRDPARLSAHLEALGVPHEVLVHEGVGHSFMNDHPGVLFALGRYTPLAAAHDEAAEASGWRAMIEWFDQHLGSAAAQGS